MSQAFQCLLILALLLGGGAFASAAEEETRAFGAAENAFRDRFHQIAENSFSNFVANFPQSPRVAQAILLQARSAFEQGRFEPATGILTTNLSRAGTLADQFQFWLGKVHLEAGRFDAAAGAFDAFLKSYTNSPLRLDASFGEAYARFKLKQWPAVENLLGDANASFQSAAKTRGTNDPLVLRGHLLLGEALFEQRKLAAAEQLLSQVDAAAAPSSVRWERQYLLCKVQFAAQRPEAALQGTTNLLGITVPDGQASLRASAVALQGGILEAMGRLDAASEAYQANLAPGVPAERRREAFLKTVELALSQDRVGDAIVRLDKFLAEQPGETNSDVVLLTLGELKLKQHQLVTTRTNVAVPGVTNAAQATNLLEQALSDLNRVLRDHSGSPQAPKAQLNRGWALLASGRSAESLGAFQAAAETLPHSEPQAVARFKLADVQFAAGDLTNAIANYHSVLTNYAGFPRVQREVADRAAYQMVQAGIAAGHLNAAEKGVSRMLAFYPQSFYADRTLLLYGQALDDPAASRKVFAEFADRYPQSALLPEVKLAMARSYVREQNWPSAIAEYEQWVARFPTNQNLPRAEFNRAQAYFQAGQETNALPLFTNFVQRFLTHALAQRAQDWIGDYYYRREDFREAERNYQLLFTERTISTNWPVNGLTFEARLKAGRAAYRRQSWDQALSYFTNLINDAGCPPSVAVDAIFAYGDTFMEKSTNALAGYSRGSQIFDLIPRDYPTHPDVPRAWGRMADCHFNLASIDPAQSKKDYARAYELYARATNAPTADVSTRSQAEVGMGHVLRRQASLAASAEAGELLDGALQHYLNVVYGTNLRADEKPDPLWVKEAAEKGALVAESRKKWDQAIALYQRLYQMVPVLRTSMEKRIELAREQQALQRQ